MLKETFGGYNVNKNLLKCLLCKFRLIRINIIGLFHVCIKCLYLKHVTI